MQMTVLPVQVYWRRENMVSSPTKKQIKQDTNGISGNIKALEMKSRALY